MSELSQGAVRLTIGPEGNDGKLISRMKLPDDAIRAALEIDESHLEDGEARSYEVWTYEV
jgi:hypothetical protein